MKCIFSLPYDGDLANLEHLEIKGCSQLEQVFSCELKIHEQESNNNLLPNLKYLSLKNLPKITHICASVPILLKFLSIRVFEVKHCLMFQNRENLEESEDYDYDDFDFDDEDFIEFETRRQFLHMSAPSCTLPDGEVEPSQSTRCIEKKKNSRSYHYHTGAHLLAAVCLPESLAFVLPLSDVQSLARLIYGTSFKLSCCMFLS